MMHVLFEAAKRWRLPLVCCAWMLCLLGLLVRKGYETFLAANFLPVIVMAAAALLPMAFVSLARRTAPRFGMREALGTAIILLPLVYIYHAGGTTLGVGSFNTRYVGRGSVAAGTPSSEQDAPEGGTSLLSLVIDPEKYEGQHIIVVGMLAKNNPQVDEIMGRKLPILFRFAISCCAADASPLALVLDDARAESFRDDDWIEASGTFHVREVGEYQLLVLEKADIRATRTPEQPYLSFTWGIF